MKTQQTIHSFDTLLKTIQNRIQENRQICIIIDGPCASGKTTLASKLSKVLNIEVIAMDHFFLQPHQRSSIRLAEIGGNIDYERFDHEIIKQIEKQLPFVYQPYDCHTQSLKNAISIKSPSILIIEGVYSTHPNFHYPNALKLFLNIDSQTQEQRLLQRSHALVTRFKEEWIPKEDAYFNQFHIQQQADILIDANDFIQEDE